jgi:outer membrane protein
VYQTLPLNTADPIKVDKERELAALQEGIEKFKQDAENSYQEKSTGLLDPIYKKIGDVIEGIAKEDGYDFILNPQTPSGEIVLLAKNTKYDISDLVLKKLGVTPAPTTVK